MGCVNSKKAVAGDPSSSPAYDTVTYVRSYSRKCVNGSGRNAEPRLGVSSSKGHSSSGVVAVSGQEKTREGDPKPEKDVEEKNLKERGGGNGKGSLRANGSLNMRAGVSHGFVEAEHIAAGWPPWLTSVAGEAIQGWIPLKSDAFEKLDKV